MRYYRIPKGKYTGTYEIFESREEFKSYHPNEEAKLWDPNNWNNDFKIGDWIEAMDGFIVPLLNIYQPFKNAKIKTSYEPIWQYGFPMTGILVRQKKNGDWIIGSFYALYTIPDKYSFSGATQRWRSDTKGDANKILFAKLIANGVDIYKAVRQLDLNKNHIAFRTQSQYLRLAEKYMQDELVQKEIVSALSPFTSELTDRIPIKKIVNEIETLLDKSKKGSDSHRRNIEFVMQLQGIANKGEDEKPQGHLGKDIDGIPESKYTEVENIPIPD